MFQAFRRNAGARLSATTALIPEARRGGDGLLAARADAEAQARDQDVAGPNPARRTQDRSSRSARASQLLAGRVVVIDEAGGAERIRVDAVAKEHDEPAGDAARRTVRPSFVAEVPAIGCRVRRRSGTVSAVVAGPQMNPAAADAATTAGLAR